MRVGWFACLLTCCVGVIMNSEIRRGLAAKLNRTCSSARWVSKELSVLTPGLRKQGDHSLRPSIRRNPDEHGDRPALEEGDGAANSCSLGFGCRFESCRCLNMSFSFTHQILRMQLLVWEMLEQFVLCSRLLTFESRSRCRL